MHLRKIPLTTQGPPGRGALEKEEEGEEGEGRRMGAFVVNTTVCIPLYVDTAVCIQIDRYSILLYAARERRYSIVYIPCMQLEKDDIA